MTHNPMFGLLVALWGAFVLTPDTLFMRWSGMNGMQMLAWRGSLMGISFIACWYLLSNQNRLGDLRCLFSTGGLIVVAGQFLGSSLFCIGIAKAPVSVVLFGVASVPVFSAIFTYLLLGEASHWSTWLAMIAVTLGLGFAVLGNPADSLKSDVNSSWGAAAGIGTAMSLAMSFVGVRRQPEASILLTVGSGALLSGIMGMVLTGPQAVLQGNVWAIVVTGVVILPLSFFSFSVASRHILPANVSLLMLLETILGPLWVWLGTGEKPTSNMIAGGVIVVVSLAVYLLYLGHRQAYINRRQT